MMQFSDVTDKQGIIQDITFLLGIDTNAYKIEDRTRNINQRNRQVWSIIFESYGGWLFQDSNLDGNPYADQTITAGVAVYPLPAAALTIRSVQLKNPTGTYNFPLTPISMEEFKKLGGEANYSSSNATGTPTLYLPYEDSFRLLPGPNYTFASTGIRVTFDQDMVDFEADDDIEVPGFAAPFHRILSIGAALDYALARGMADKVVYLQNLWNDYERRMKDFYSKRYLDKFPHKIGAGLDLMREFS